MIMSEEAPMTDFDYTVSSDKSFDQAVLEIVDESK